MGNYERKSSHVWLNEEEWKLNQQNNRSQWKGEKAADSFL